MKVLVTGGREYQGGAALWTLLDEINPDAVIHGGARGADYFAGWWARSRGKEEIAVPASWNILGMWAGRSRNMKMLRMKPDLVVACPGGDGTRDCVTKAHALGIKVRYV